LADRHGFAVLFPEQRRTNNANLCFNWFEPQDTQRGSGEALSIRQMIDTLVATHDLDRARVFITGLSAGGAMASTMLAAYPEVFAGGAIMAGLAHGIARTVPEAFDRMRGSGMPSREHLQRIMADSSAHEGPWPSISVWHGEADTIVDPANAQAILEQWKAAHGVSDAAPRVETAAGHRRMSWANGEGRVVLEHYSIAQMGHGTAIDPRIGIGKAGPYMLDAGISSTHRVAHAWGLVPAELPQESRTVTEAPAGKPAPSIQRPTRKATASRRSSRMLCAMPG
jgi:poly(hydroxyalkanoate) depolymerase family esterase